MQSPYECIFKTKPDYKFLKVFGCLYFPFLRDYNTHKFHFHTSKCVLLGYSPLHKGYKCMHSSGKIFIASHVLFDKTSFPYTSDSKFLTSPSKPSNFHYSLLQSYVVSIPNSNQETFEVGTAVDEAQSHHFNDHFSLDSHNTTFDASHIQQSLLSPSSTQ